ncbi:hypothetical protein [Halomicrobium salinisoli]|uniref:hypothetical protein n=1 Tax=Halomicrobium salinisoli TaxID=2878391 RepID=UPI001CF0B44E|nr:hypothetical protein [Halomicrobium salinisoli]
MPAKTGLSHAGAAFTSVLLGLTVETYVERLALLESVTDHAGRIVTATTGGSVDPGLGGPLLVATGLSFVWGVFYHAGRFDASAGR